MGNRQSAIEWLVQQLKNEEYLGTFCSPECWPQEEQKMRAIIEKAKAMEKQQIMDAVNATMIDDDLNAYEYFTETYE
jgi:hypothetical protein